MTAAPKPSDPVDPAGSTATHTGPATASGGGFANSGVVRGGVHQHLPPPPPPAWPLLVGAVPPLASAFQPRAGLRDRIRAAQDAGTDVVLTQRRHTAHLLAGMGGVGKSQLAASFAHDALSRRSTDLVVWIGAGSPDQIISAYASAADRVQAPGAAGADLTGAARCFLDWLHTTDRSWLIVLDDITDPAHLKGWWPPQHRKGWTLATTRLRDVALTGSGRHAIPIDTYTPAEAAAYLTQRLTGDGYAHPLGGVDDLAEALGYLPLALSHAAAYLLQQDEPCATYLRRYRAGESRLAELMPEETDPDEYGRPVAVTLLLALDAADAAAPRGLARPALALAALLDPAGHPDTLWASDAVARYLTAHRTTGSGGPGVTGEQARKAVRLLHRYGLITDTSGGPRAIRIHALTARAMRESVDDLTAAAHAAAEALLEIWPAIDHSIGGLPDALRANTTILYAHTGDALWHSGARRVLSQAGQSLLNARLHATATTHWRAVTESAIRILGERHPDTLTARANLASAYWYAGRTGEAIELSERVLADRVAVLGGRHPATLLSRANLASSYWQAGRTGEAVELLEGVLADSVSVLGEGHPATLLARANLAGSYWQAGRAGEAVELFESVVPDRVKLLGERHPDTLLARANLAGSYAQVGRVGEAVELFESVLPDSVAVLGERHPATLLVRANLAGAYRQVGRIGEAVELLESVVTDRVKILGARHPDTLFARANLASLYRRAGRAGAAMELLEQVLTDSMEINGPRHPHTRRMAAALENWRAGGR